MGDGIIITREIAALPKRDDEAHKGDVGRIVVLGGSAIDPIMIGAPALAANAALKSGAGLVQIVVPRGIENAVAVLAPCATLRHLSQTGDSDAVWACVEMFACDVLAVGPGLGDTLPVDVLVSLIDRVGVPVVVDADGLNTLAKAGAFRFAQPSRVVLTPHPGEMRRLVQACGLDLNLDRTPESRQAVAVAVARHYGCHVVLKGRHTVVTDGHRVYINETGNAGMATGGAGDVLTGVVAALLGQKLEPLEAAILAVYLHGLAGDFAAEELGRHSLTATDIITYLPEAFCDHGMSHAE